LSVGRRLEVLLCFSQMDAYLKLKLTTRSNRERGFKLTTRSNRERGFKLTTRSNHERGFKLTTRSNLERGLNWLHGVILKGGLS